MAAVSFTQWRAAPPARATRHSRVIAAAAAVVKVGKPTKVSQLSKQQAQQLELQLLQILRNAKGRGKAGLSDEQQEELKQIVEVLEADGGIDAPTTSGEVLDGQWRLLYTSRPGTASPIQRTFTGVEGFSVFQEVELLGDTPRVNNIVDFGPNVGYLKVEAEASTDSRPLPNFTPRQGAGLALFGRSFNYSPARQNMRIDFQFDRAAFYFKILPFTLPYPVPFRLLGDETKGWIDVTYMNSEGTVRLSRGNKGTLFILTKDVPLTGRLLKAIENQDDEQVLALIELIQQDSPVPDPARSELASGKWRLIWSQQAGNANPFQKLGAKTADSFQIIDGEAGTAENIANLTPWLTLKAEAECGPESDTRTTVTFKELAVYLGALKLPLPVPGRPNNPSYIDWLYLDQDLRVTRGKKGSLFIHRREV